MNKLKRYESELEVARAQPLTSEEESAVEESEEETGSEEEEADVAEDGGKKQDKILSMAKEDITFEMVSEKIKEIMLNRGKKTAIKQERIEMLQYLLTVAKGSIQTVMVLQYLTSSLFDFNQSMMTTMKISNWKLCVKYCFQVLISTIFKY